MSATNNTHEKIKRQVTVLKYESIHRRFHELYIVKRLRYDDVELTLCAEFYIGPKRLNAILKMNL